MRSRVHVSHRSLALVLIPISACALSPAPASPSPLSPPSNPGIRGCKDPGLLSGLTGETHRIEADGPIVIGSGYSLATGVPRATAVEASAAPEPREYSIEYVIDYAESTKDLARSLGVKLSASGSWGTGSASGKMSLLRQSRSHAYSAYLVVSAKAVSRVEVAGLTSFKTSALDLLRHDARSFYATFGDGFVYRRAWGAGLDAVLRVEAKRPETKEAFSASLKAAAGTFRASGAVATSLSEVLTGRKVRISYVQRGGGYGREVCLDSSGTDENCKQWPKGVDGPPKSRGGAVALSVEELITRVRDFSLEVETKHDNAQLLYFDVLDYGSVPEAAAECFVDRIKRQQELDDLVRSSSFWKTNLRRSDSRHRTTTKLNSFLMTRINQLHLDSSSTCL